VIAVQVVLLNWNSATDTVRCLDSLRTVTDLPFSVIVVDNGSCDGSADEVARRFPGHTLLRAPRNLGFAGGNNLGIRLALERGARYVLLLNNDTVVTPDFLAPLVAAIEQADDVGAVQSKLLRLDSPAVVDSLGQCLSARHGARDLSQGERDPGPGEPREIFGACAAGALYRREVFERVGLLDEDFFVIYEDVDLSWRMRLAGFRTLLVPASVIHHRRGISGSRTSPEKRYHNKKNLLNLLVRYWPARLLLKHGFAFGRTAVQGGWQAVRLGRGGEYVSVLRRSLWLRRAQVSRSPAIRALQERWIEE
jgi:GT2 family glycosyltransferase